MEKINISAILMHSYDSTDLTAKDFPRTKTDCTVKIMNLHFVMASLAIFTSLSYEKVFIKS